MSRLSKKMMALLLTGVMTMSLAACGSSGSTETGSSSGSTTTPQLLQKRQKEEAKRQMQRWIPITRMQESIPLSM